MIDLVGKSVFVRTQEEYESLLKMAKLQRFTWSYGRDLNLINIPIPNVLNFYNDKTITYKSGIKLWEASDVMEDEKKLREAIAHVKYFANNKDRMSLTDKVIESILLLADTVETQIEEVK
nr:hypothetical protein [uncultured Blautia sp.]